MYHDGEVSWEENHKINEADYDLDLDSSRVFDDDGNEIRGDEDD